MRVALDAFSLPSDPPDGDSVRSRADMLSVSDSAHGEVVKSKPRLRTKLPQAGGVAGEGGGATGMLPVSEEGQDRDLKVTTEERDKIGTKSDVYISYKIRTEVRGG